MKNNRILLVTEGTYPVTPGGVSTWSHLLIQSLRDYKFDLLCLASNPYLVDKYLLPEHVVNYWRVPLWGTIDPADYDFSRKYSKIVDIRMSLQEMEIIRGFVPLLEEVLEHIMIQGEERGSTAPRNFGQVLHKIYRYFDRGDLYTTFRSKVVWQVFYAKATEIANRWQVEPKLVEVIEALRLMYRLFFVLAWRLEPVQLAHATAASWAAVPCILAKEEFGSAFILTEHGVYLREQYLFLAKQKMSSFLGKFLLGLTKSIVKSVYYYTDLSTPVCKYNSRWQEAHGLDPEKIYVIYNGVDPNIFNPQPEQLAKEPTVVTLARIDPLKDIENLIRAAKITRKEVPNATFKLYGPIANEKYHKQCNQLIADLKINDGFQFAGHSSSPAKVYNLGHVVALPSLSEAFPYTVIEAMMCGKAVVATSVGGVAEALEGVGMLVEPRNPEAIAEACTMLLQDANLNISLAEQAREKALNNFSTETFGRQYNDAYQLLLQKYL